MHLMSILEKSPSVEDSVSAMQTVKSVSIETELTK